MQNKNPQGNFDPIPDSDEELEKYGVWVKAEPQDVLEELETEHQPLVIESISAIPTTEDLSDTFEELEEMQAFDQSDTDIFEGLSPLEDGEPSKLEMDSEEAESIDLSDFSMDEPEEMAESTQNLESIDFDLDLDEVLLADTDSVADTEPFEFVETEPEIGSKKAVYDNESKAFDDVRALQDDLASPQPTSGGFSGDLLQKIALELSSIKEELVSLRSQLSELKRDPEQAAPEEQKSEEDSVKGGFFDDEDDDTIALTGDELDNILNTADFTVEPPEDLTTPEGLDESEFLDTADFSASSDLSLDSLDNQPQNLLPEDGSYFSTETLPDTESDTEESIEQGIQAIDGEDLIDLDFGNEEELSPLEIIPEINAITESPEDTSYLDEETAELSDGFELDASPLDEVPLVEPNPTELDIGSEIDDVLAAESSENLPFMETADEDDVLSLEDSDEDIVLSIDGDEQLASNEDDDLNHFIDEVEEIEPFNMDPFEDEIISELELHKEGSRQTDGSWTAEPESSSLSTLEEEVEPQAPQALEEVQSIGLDSSSKDFEDIDFDDNSLLDSQVVEDLGGEDLETIEDVNLEEIASDEYETLDEELLEDLDDENMPGTESKLEEMEELSEVDAFDVELETAEPELAEKSTMDDVSKTFQPHADSETSTEPESTQSDNAVPDKLKQDVKSVLLYLDQLLASLPEEKIEEFASSEYYDTYKKLFEDLGLL